MMGAVRVWLSAALLSTAVACGTAAPAPSATSSCAPSSAVWAASDYLSSAVGALSLTRGTTASTFGVNLGGDPALAMSRGRTFFIARDQDLIFEVDPACGTPKPPILAHLGSITGPSDPQDVAVASDGSLWVPLYDVPVVLVLGPDDTVRRTIDLSSYDSDGNPEASAIAIVSTPRGEKAFVALQRLSPSFRSEQPSWMLRVDVATGVVEAHVELVGRNPFGMFQAGAVLWLAEPGNFDSADEPLAGIERFDTSTSATALFAHEVDLGGSVAQVAVSGRCGVAIVADATSANATSLVTFDGESGRVIRPSAVSPLATAGFDLQGLTWVGTTLLVGDRRRAANGYPVHALNVTSGCALSPTPDVTFLPLPPVAVR